MGNDTAYGTKLPGTTDDALILEAQIVELKEKPSLPVGEVGVDAFGQKPHYEDRGIIKRAIIAIGRQDTDPDSMEPLDKGVDILGASSDHMILDVTKSEIIKWETSFPSNWVTAVCWPAPPARMWRRDTWVLKI